jgi:segregation and condensation protein A
MNEVTILQAGSQAAYRVHTPVFEGPLDLLLKLIEKNELDITRVALAEVTDEFMEHVDSMRAEMAIEVIADFLFIAAKLLWIKSRALLPRPPAAAVGNKHEDDDLGDELLRQLRAYRQYKETAGWLRQRDHDNLRAYVRGSHKPRPKRVTLDLSDLTLERLSEIADMVLFPTEMPRPEGAIQRSRLSISQQIGLVRERLTRWVTVSFRKLLGSSPTRLEAVVTLQAVLELMKQRGVIAKQLEMFGDILIEKAEEADPVAAAESDVEAEPVY